MARPKSKEPTRHESVRVRVTTVERAEMALEAAKMDVSISEYLRFLHKAYRDSVSSP